MGKFGSHYGENFDTYDEEVEFTLGENTVVRFTKDGRIQIKAKKGTAHLLQNGVLSFTTTSTSFVDVTGLSTKHLPKSLSTKKNQNKLKQIYRHLKKNKTFLKKLADKSPLELEFLDIDIGLIKARFKPKKRKSKTK